MIDENLPQFVYNTIMHTEYLLFITFHSNEFIDFIPNNSIKISTTDSNVDSQTRPVETYSIMPVN